MTVLVVSSDAGGTIALAPVVHEMSARRISFHVAASGPAVQIWRGDGRPFESLTDTISESDAVHWLQQHAIGAVLSGAGAYNRIEHTFRRAAAQLGLFCFALVDGWFNFGLRFQRVIDGHVVHSLPNLIGVMDESCVTEMVGEGFDREMIVIVGAPHIEETIRYVRSATVASISHLRERFGLRDDLMTFAFFSTPVVRGRRRAAIGNPDLGYTQETILQEVIQTLSDACAEFAMPVRLVVKPHPSESVELLSEVLRTVEPSPFLQCCVLEDCDAKELIILADAVLGMTSTALLEAALSGKPAVSVQIGRNVSSNPDRHFTNRAGIIPIFDSAHGRQTIRQLLREPRHLQVQCIPPAKNEAAVKVVDALCPDGVPRRDVGGMPSGEG